MNYNLDIGPFERAMDKARELGAVSAADYVVDGRTRFSTHYFNKDGDEICFHIIGFDWVTALDKPRKWPEALKHTYGVN